MSTELDMLAYSAFPAMPEKGPDGKVELKCSDSVVKRGSSAIELKLSTVSCGFEMVGRSGTCGSELSEPVVDAAGRGSEDCSC